MTGRLVRGLALVLLIVVPRPDAFGQATGLADAVKRGDRSLARSLASDRAAVNAPEPDGTTPLHWAVRSNDVEMVQLLVRSGADVTTANRYGITPLWQAAANGHAAIVEMLLTAGADANTTLPEGETVLMTASRTDSAGAVRSLLAHGAKVNSRESWHQQTALMWAAAANRAAVAQVLVEYGADLDARATVLEEIPQTMRYMQGSQFPRGGFTPLMFAARQGALEATRVLVDAGADLRKTEPEYGTSALVLAIINAHYDIAALLVEKGADVNYADVTGRTALYAAVDMRTLDPVTNRPPPRASGQLDSIDVVRLLLDSGADPNARLATNPPARAAGGSGERPGATPLVRAAKYADITVMRLLLDYGADMHAKTDNGTTVLMAAAGMGSVTVSARGVLERDEIEAITLSLDYGVDVNAVNDNGETALHGAAGRGVDTVVQYLASRGALLDLKDATGRTPLDVALGVGRSRQGDKEPTNETTVALIRGLLADAAFKGSPPR